LDNPRFIKDNQFEKLVKSITEFPEMADVREIVINTDNEILGGNMRFMAMKKAGWKDVPVRIVDWSLEKQREFIIKDNVSGGEWDWDVLANEWDVDVLDEWGVNFPVNKDVYGDDDTETTDGDASEKNEVVIKMSRDEYELIEPDMRELLARVKHTILK